MSFDSLTYLLFLPGVVLLHWLCPHRARWALLLAASLVFYASWNVPLTLLLLAVIALTYLAGRLISAEAEAGKRRILLVLTLGACISGMLYFKYFRFLAEVLGAVAGLFGVKGTWQVRDVLLPVGISFYSFQAMSYVIDVYRDASRCERHFGYYALYICFFPQLVAGPIERSDALLPQLRSRRVWTEENLRAGFLLLLSGFFRKMVLADFCGGFVTAVFSASCPDGSAVCLGAVLFAVQIYNDFAGYSEIARGSARLLGISLMRNFDRPYLSGSMREFWRRWHISLSRWFTDYVYIPLGGSRRGLPRQIVATLAVFALSGLWHGANWTFVVWGLFHGLVLSAEMLMGSRFNSGRQTILRRALSTGLTFGTVCVSWIFFRAESLQQAFFLMGRLLSPWDVRAGLAATGFTVRDVLWLVPALLQGRLPDNLTRDDAPPLRDITVVYLILSIALAWLVRLEMNGQNAFIYFRF